MQIRPFIEKLEKEHRLLHVSKDVGTDYEIAAYLKKYDGKPVIFDSVKGYSIKVVGNLMSNMDLFCEWLGIENENWIEALKYAIENPGSYEETEANPFQYYEPDLNILPILKHYPYDQGRYITSGVVFVNRKGLRNISFHRLAVIGEDRLVGRLVEQRDLHTIYMDAKEHGEDVDIAIAIGNSAGVLVAAATSVERGKYELNIAGSLEKENIKVVNAKTNSTHYPADSMIVLEGKILHDETAKEGPFVDLTNTYDIVREQPVFVIDKIAMQKDAIYQALLPGGNEHKILMGAPRTPTIYKALKDVGIDVADIYLTEGGSGWLDVVIAIRKKSEEDPKKAFEAAIKGHRSLKKVTVVDDDINPRDANDVNYAVTMYWCAGKEQVLNNVKGSSLDPMASPDGFGSKLFIDATRPINVPPEKQLKMKRASMNFKIN